MQSWLLLIFAILLEITGTTCMKLSKGFTNPVPSVLMFVFYGAGLIPLAMALKKIEVSVAYAVWSGLGTALIAIIGIIWFKEHVGALKIVSILLVVLGIVGLNLSGGTH